MKRVTMVLAMALAAVSAGVAAAQAPAQPQSSAPPVVGRSPLGVVSMEAVVVGWSAKRDLMGKTVLNDRKERIGKIDDLIITPSDNPNGPFASFAIVGVGGFLGVGTKDVAIPAEQFKMQGNDLMLPGATKDALKGLPPFQYQRRK
ncbi:MAG: PRC-barrel domain-containing protein [Massilia sp.]